MAQRVKPALTPLVAPLIAFLIAAAVISATGGRPAESLSALLQGAGGDIYKLMRTLARATPLLFSGLAVSIALRAGLFNIGVEGQLLVGGLAAGWAGFALKGLPMVLHLPISLAAGALAGALWAAVPGFLRAWRGSHEVIVTIMMNYIAINLTHWLVNGPLRDHSTSATATPKVLETARLPVFDLRSGLSAGFVLAVLAAAAYAFIIRRTALGFEIRAVGSNPDAAAAAGVDVRRRLLSAMLLSGMLAGTAGAVEVLAVHLRFFDAFSPGYGFDSIAVALLGGLQALGVTLSAILFGALGVGANYMDSITGTPKEIAGIVQAVVILAAAARFVKRRSAE